MNTIVQRLDGTTYDLEQIGIVTRDFNPSSPSYRHDIVSDVMKYGDINTGTMQGSRIIKCSFYLKAYDMITYVIHRDEVFRIFRSEEPFYLIDTRNPGKRWLVKTNGSFDIDQQRIYGLFDIEFISFSPFAESLISTSEPFTFDSNKLQIGMNLPTNKDLIYTHTTNAFEIYNAGDVEVDPRQFPLTITVTGAWNDVFLRNVTTDETFRYYEPLVSGDVLTLDRVKVSKNGVSVYGDTNRIPLTIAPGWNTFSVAHYTGPFSISFDFRFRYL